ncbi:low temperature requirement protein A [Streptomyces sparsogenes]|uniref:low temperature requirement protein A n=1 Tax=Streptomyces sparsogenes TaxID=67365 RepID=UPI0033CC3E40
MRSERLTDRLFRQRSPHGTPVTPFELFFDLVYVFAVTQLGHGLAEHFTVAGAAQTLLLLAAVWWAWMYTSWTTNWFHPDHVAVRLTLVGVMLASLVMAAAIPSAFDGRGLWFAGAYAAIQVGRSLFVAVAARSHPLGPTFQRILAWHSFTAVLWIAGGLADGPAGAVLWTAALALEYAAPWHGYTTPFLGRSHPSEWTIDAEHMAERCRLFMLIVLGESLLVAGATFSGAQPSAGRVAAFLSAFTAAVALWWIYFHRAADAAGERIAASGDPGRLGRSAYTYLHVPVIAGVIVTAVAVKTTIAHPTGTVTAGTACAILGGPLLFLAGHLLFTRAVFGHLSRSRLLALAALAALGLTTAIATPLMLMGGAAAVLLSVAAGELRGGEG